MERWKIVPLTPPAILRGCPRCGVKKRFISSGLFRVNANGNRIDVWLIYRCCDCDATLNLDVLTRVNPKTIPRDIYDRYAANDDELALITACDTALLKKNKAEPDYETASYRTEREGDHADGLVRLLSPCAMNLRLDKVLAEGLGISRASVGRMLESGEITAVDAAFPVNAKTKVLGDILLRVPAEAEKEA